MNDMSNIWREVSAWPPTERLALATQLLRSLQQEDQSVPVSEERQAALRQLIGIWKSVPPPSDEQVEGIIKQARMKKYG